MHKYALPVLTAVALHAGVVGVFLVGHGGDPSALVCTGDERENESPYAAIGSHFRGPGYDGQFYYAIAQAPFRRHEVGIDFAPMRQSRILYPLICWSLSGGDPDILLWVMPLVNLLAIGGLVALGVYLASRYGLNPWWGLSLSLAVNPAIPLLRDLGDVVSTLAVALLLVAWACRWPWWAVAVGALAAVLSREQNVPIVLIVLAVAGGKRQWLVTAASCAALLVWGAWIAALWQLYDVWPFHPTHGAFDRPLAGLWLRLSHFKPLSAHSVSITMILLQVGLAAYLLWGRFARRDELPDPPRLPKQPFGPQVDPAVMLVALFGASLALMGGAIFYCDVWSYARVFAMLPLAVWIGCVQVRNFRPLALMSLHFLVPVAAAFREVVTKHPV